MNSLEIVRTRVANRNVWALVGEGALPGLRTSRVTTDRLEALAVGKHEVADHVERVMTALELNGSERAATPGGADWLYVQRVPVRRLVTQLVRKLIVLDAWEPFARSPGPLTPVPHEALIGVRDTSAQEYRSYTVTWSGIAYLLGAPAPHNPFLPEPQEAVRRPGTASVPSHLRGAEVVALSWSSRHWQTLLPVLHVLGKEGHRSVLVDLSSDPSQQCTAPLPPGVSMVSAPASLFSSTTVRRYASGTVGSHGPVVPVGTHKLRLNRLEQVVAALLECGGGCTQPSWDSVVRVERWLDEVLLSARPHTLLVANDTSPLGALAVHNAQHHALNTVYVQHGAWSAEAVSWPALHSRYIVVMGRRDAELASAWARHPDAEVHVLGQPRFDALARLDRKAQRRTLNRMITAERIVVWACQPFAPERLTAHADLLREGLAQAPGSWGLVVAPHPAQNPDTFTHLLTRGSPPPVAIVPARDGARGVLAGADVLASAYSTCGIEAALLKVPVLEIGPPSETTLGLAAHGLARRCVTPDDVAKALTETPVSRTSSAMEEVCRWRGTSAYDIAQLIIAKAPVHHNAL
ncbi:hypothetical protein [Streptomyces niveiscabiei]|uniref:Capsule polysaccharide biosynthesis protein n=1 Tax=Streptomyces niveiscabiei TaxID=164115 RepID=A0ABW9I618_9ACTN